MAEARAGGDKLIDGSFGASVEIQEADLHLQKCGHPKKIKPPVSGQKYQLDKQTS